MPIPTERKGLRIADRHEKTQKADHQGCSLCRFLLECGLVDIGKLTNLLDADALIPYLKKNGYNYVELMPLNEYPADESWGYQATGFFSPTSHYGTPDELRTFVNECHKNHIGVIMDFVPVHFAVNDYALWNNYTEDSFEWLDCQLENECIYSFFRRSDKKKLLSVFNFSDNETEYTMSLGDIKELSLIIETDDQRFGGQGVPDTAVTTSETSVGYEIKIVVPFAVVITLSAFSLCDS